MARGSAGHGSLRAPAWIPMRRLPRRREGGHLRNLAGGRGWGAPRFFALPPMPTNHFRRAPSWEGVHHRGAAGEETRIHRRTPSPFPVRVHLFQCSIIGTVSQQIIGTVASVDMYVEYPLTGQDCILCIQTLLSAAQVNAVDTLRLRPPTAYANDVH